MDLRALVAVAYRVNSSVVTGLRPPYLAFDVFAKIPPGATQDEVSRMWQHLLADRFRLVAHRETKEMPAYLLVAGKRGLKLKESAEQSNDAEESAGQGLSPRGRDKDGFPTVPAGRSLVSYKGDRGYIVASKYSIGQFASLLEGFLAAGTRAWLPVVDDTHLGAKYDFRLTWEVVGDGPSDAQSLINALESQLGLRLQQKRAQIELLIVDHAETSPTEN